MSEPRPARSGCALSLGVLLVASGALLLASNLFGFSLAWLWTGGLVWFGTYWPILLIVWGGYKLYKRIVHPESARVGAGEVLLLFFIVVAGLTVHFARRVVTGMPVEISIDDVIESIGADISFGPAHTFSEEQRLELPSDTGLLVENLRGAVTVEAWDEKELKVRLTKRVYLLSEENAAEVAREVGLRLDAAPDGPARLHVETPSDGAKVESDLELWVPRTTALTVTNGRGPIRVTGLRAPVGLATSEDSIEVRDIVGRLMVEGRRGPVRLERIQGDVEARNRYGTLTAKDVEGDFIGETSNGSLDVERVTGTARLSNRHSRIRVSRVEGDLTIEATHTEITAEELGGTAAIETSYRPLFVRGVEDRLSIEARSSEIEIRGVKGNLDVNNINSSVTAVGVGGGVTLTAEKGEVRLDDIAGPIEVHSSNHPVRVDNFRSSLNVKSEHAPLQISTPHLAGEVELVSSYGDVRLMLPLDASFRLEARVKGGEVISDFRRPEWEETKRDETVELRGLVGEGGRSIVVETSYGDIRIIPGGAK